PGAVAEGVLLQTKFSMCSQRYWIEIARSQRLIPVQSLIEKRPVRREAVQLGPWYPITSSTGRLQNDDVIRLHRKLLRVRKRQPIDRAAARRARATARKS